MEHSQASTLPPRAGGAERMDIRFVAGESYEVGVRGHRVLVDQPAAAGGEDTAPAPTELFAASLATCVAFYAGSPSTWPERLSLPLPAVGGDRCHAQVPRL